jgi:hypothetical protein
MKSRLIRTSRRMLGIFGLFSLVLVSTPGQAGVVNGVQDIEGVKFYLGVVPAEIVLGHPAGHPESTMHGGTPGPSIHNMHLLVALFSDATGARIINATVIADIMERGGRRWSVPLRPMTVNGALTFGGYTAFPKASDYTITVRVDRPSVRRLHPVTADFSWNHD